MLSDHRGFVFSRLKTNLLLGLLSDRKWFVFSFNHIRVCYAPCHGLLKIRTPLSRRRPKSLARLSRPRVVGAPLPRRRPSFASLVATTALPQFVSLAFLSRRVPPAPSVFASLVATTASQITRASLASLVVATAYTSRTTRARVSAAGASCAVDLPRIACRHGGVACASRLSRSCSGVRPRRRRSSLASLIVTAASHVARASLAIACRRCAPPAPSTLLRVALRHDGVACVSPHRT